MIQELINLATFFAPFDRVDLLAACGGLQLLPENTGCTMRLLAAATMAASLSEAEQLAPLGIEEVQQLSALPEMTAGALVEQETPPINPFTEAFTFVGGSYLVFPGRVEEATYVVEHLVKALFLSPTPFPDSLFVQEVQDLLEATLIVSDTIAQRAGLSRGIAPSFTEGPDPIVVPDANSLSQLQKAVTFSIEALSTLLEEHGLSLQSLAPLMISHGTSSVPEEVDELLARGPLSRHPLVQYSEQVIVAAPGLLLAAVRHAIVLRAKERGVCDALAQRYTDAVWSTSLEALERLEHPRLLPSSSRLPELPCSAMTLCSLESDKALYVCLVTDPLHDYEADTVFSICPEADIEAWSNAIERGLLRAQETILSMQAPPRHLLCLILAQGLGRGIVLNSYRRMPDQTHVGIPATAGSIEQDAILALAMSGADLRTISFLELGGQLALWKYARALKRIDREVLLEASSVLDLFALYREDQHSFSPLHVIASAARAAQPARVSVPPLISPTMDGAASLRLEVQRRYDPHGAPAFVPGATTDVLSRYETPHIPVYVERGSLKKRTRFLVEGLPVPIWVMAARHAQLVEEFGGERGQETPEESEDVEQSAPDPFDTLASEFADALAYWLWQCTPSLQPLLEPLVSVTSSLRFFIKLTPDASWLPQVLAADPPSALASEVALLDGPGQPTADDGAPQEEEDCFTIRTDPATSSLVILLRPPLRQLLAAPDNRGERLLLVALFKRLRDLLPEHARDHWPETDDIQALVDRHAPLGLKKRIFYLEHTTPDMDPRGLWPVRSLQEADLQEIRDICGGELLARGVIQEGEVEPSQQTRVLNAAVDQYYAALQRLVASLAPDGLLEWFISQHESFVRDEGFRLVNLAPQLACFSSKPEMVDHLREVYAELMKATVASRFVIEYVGAQPPQGNAVMSLEIYDRLLALAAEIVQVGSASDLLELKLVEAQVLIFPSGRMALDVLRYPEALHVHFGALAAGELERAPERFLSQITHDEDPAADPVPQGSNAESAFFQRIEQAVMAEFGFTLTELNEFLSEAEALGDEIDPVLGLLPLETFVARMADRLHWNRERVREALHHFTLERRDAFDPPPVPFTSADVYPWRFGRRLSYVRRPFLLREDASGTTVLWGPRHLYQARKYFLEQCVSGRLRATSAALGQIRAAQADAQGTAFTRKVAALCQHQPGLRVRIQVSRVGRHRLIDAQGDMGDIDVLVCDAGRRRLWLLECKCLAMARTPRELANELAALFEDFGGPPAATARQHRRTAWVRAHLEHVLTWLQVPAAPHTEHWHVQPVIVVDEELLSPYMQPAQMPMVTLATFTRHVIRW